jgi:16S rRNA G527 N7-methylase RsmG
VDSSSEKARYLNRLLRKHKIEYVISVCDRAEKIDYQESEILVINTSTNDMVGTEWLSRIPEGAMVVIQGRDNQEESNGIETLENFDEQYPLSEDLYLGKIEVLGVDEDLYRRFMKIGIR